MDDQTSRNIRRVAELVAKADALLITAGAGMGVDSGLPDFRGRDGFWRGYPVLEQRGLGFRQMAQPAWFASDPETAWAFYGHRQQLYRETRPHDGFNILLDWGRAMRGGCFVVTSNVDGQFEAAEFAAERVLAVHGSLFHYQCLTPCRKQTWRSDNARLDIDLDSMRAREPLPRCPYCGRLARPNVLMFDDGAWVTKHRDAQRGRYQHWLAGLKGRRIVAVELGAGTAIPTIRRLGEDLVARGLATLVRINPQASTADEPALPIKLGALDALTKIEAALPEHFRKEARSDVVSAPQAETSVPNNAGRGLAPKRARTVEFVEFFDDADRPVDAARGGTGDRATKPLRLKVGPVTAVDMGTGEVTELTLKGFGQDQDFAFLERYAEAQTDWVQVPPCNGLEAPGYTMTARVLSSPDEPSTSPGAGIVFVQAPDEQAVATFGVGRRMDNAPALWSILYSSSDLPLAALDFPTLPWIAFRPASGLEDHPYLQPYLAEFGRVLARSYLTYLAYIDATSGGR